MMPTRESLLGIRSYDPADLHSLAELFRASWDADGIDEAVSAERLEHSLSLPGVNIERYLFVVPIEGASSRLKAAGFAIPRKGLQTNSVYIRLVAHPDCRENGLEADLLEYLEGVAAREAASTEVTWNLHASIMTGQERRIPLYRGRGYERVRGFLILERDLTEEIEMPEEPHGLQIRSIESDADVMDVHVALDESFRDHWNPPLFTEEQHRHFFNAPGFRKDLVLVAHDDQGETAGACMNFIRTDYNHERGVREAEVGVLGVRASFRRRGLARALLTRSLQLLKQDGMNTAIIEVDEESPTGANVLYESVGFRERRRTWVYEKPLNTGIMRSPWLQIAS